MPTEPPAVALKLRLLIARSRPSTVFAMFAAPEAVKKTLLVAPGIWGALLPANPSTQLLWLPLPRVLQLASTPPIQ